MSCDESAFKEWTELGLGRLKECLDEKNIEDIMSEDSPYRFGYWSVAYQLCVDVKSLSPGDFIRMLGDIELPNSGWPPFWIASRKPIAPYPYYDDFECWMYEKEFDPAHSDFWRASPLGKMFLLRGYYEDGIEEKSPNTFIDIIFPIRQTAEVLLHASEFSKKMDIVSDSKIIFEFYWEGLKNRVLGALDPNRYMSIERVCRQPNVKYKVIYSIDQIENNLVGCVYEIISRLFHPFELFSLSESVVSELIDKMLSWPKNRLRVY